jgi:hypothetical protein
MRDMPEGLSATHFMFSPTKRMRSRIDQCVVFTSLTHTHTHTHTNTTHTHTHAHAHAHKHRG